MSSADKVWKVVQKHESRIRFNKGIMLSILWDLYLVEFPGSDDKSEFTLGIDALKNDSKIIQSGEGKTSIISLP